MELLIKKSIEKEARKRLAKRASAIENARRDARRFTTRTGEATSSVKKFEPKIWTIHKHFDPMWCLRNSNVLAKGIYRSFLADSYTPIPSIRVQIEKGSGGKRDIDIFSIPDAALSALVFKNVLRRNEKYFSSSSYAFRTDKNLLDAVHYIRNFLRHPKIFIVDFDFSNFFGSISHKYLETAIHQRNLFKLTIHERAYFENLISHRWCLPGSYDIKGGERRSNGIPQGTSASLFLANISAHELDRKLEAENGIFARYSDDSVVLTNSYEDAVKVVDVFFEYSRRSGIGINYSKGGGIRMLEGLSVTASEEMLSVKKFGYLGYEFSRSATSISTRKIMKIKRTVGKIIYNNLLLYLMRGHPFNANRIGFPHFDWDLVTCMNELRWYVYGSNKEEMLRSFLENDKPIKKARGAMAFYCLTDDKNQIKALDGWLLDVISRALKHRARLLGRRGIEYMPPKREEIVDGCWYLDGLLDQDVRCPSFYTAWRAARKRWEQIGAGGIASEGGDYG